MNKCGCMNMLNEQFRRIMIKYYGGYKNEFEIKTV